METTTTTTRTTTIATSTADERIDLLVWTRRYDRLKAFQESHGHLRIGPGDDLELYKWFADQRDAFFCGTLSSRCALLFEQLDSSWYNSLSTTDDDNNDEINKAWNRNHEKLQRFQIQHGYGRYPDQSLDADLYQWIQDQREYHYYGCLDPDRLDMLDDLGIKWIPKVWDCPTYDDLLIFHKQHQHIYVEKEDDRHLYEWLNWQKKKRKQGQLPRECCKELERMGINWEMEESPQQLRARNASNISTTTDSHTKDQQRWIEWFTSLQTYTQENGGSIRHLKRYNPKVAHWLFRQKNKARKRSLDAYRHEKLTHLLGADWDMTCAEKGEAKWNKMYTSLSEHCRQFGCIPDSMNRTHQLGSWYYHQKDLQQVGKLHPDRVSMLNGLNSRFAGTQRAVGAWFKKLSLPRIYDVDDNEVDDVCTIAQNRDKHQPEQIPTEVLTTCEGAPHVHYSKEECSSSFIRKIDGRFQCGKSDASTTIPSEDENSDGWIGSDEDNSEISHGNNTTKFATGMSSSDYKLPVPVDEDKSNKLVLNVASNRHDGGDSNASEQKKPAPSNPFGTMIKAPITAYTVRPRRVFQTDEMKAEVATWETQYNALKAFKEDIGYLDETRIVEEGELGAWFKSQRSLCLNGKLDTQRYMRLRELGITWDPPLSRPTMLSWSSAYQRLCQFRMKHGHVSVMKKTDKTLYLWIRDQKINYANGTLTTEQCRKLKAIGLYDVDWQQNPNDTPVPGVDQCTSTKCATVGGVVVQSDKNEAQVPNDQQGNSTLGTSSLPLTTSKWMKDNDIRWERKYKILKTFWEEHGHINLPAGHEIKHWIYDQVREFRRGRMRFDRMEKFVTLGVKYNKANVIWETNFEKFKAYCAETGRKTVKKGDNLFLYCWVQCNQKKWREGELEPDRYKRLLEFGVIFGKQKPKFDERWDHAYNKLKEHKAKFGHLHVPQSQDSFLPDWIKRQQKQHQQGKLKPDHFVRLKSLGFFEKDAFVTHDVEAKKHYAKPGHALKWENSYAALVAFKNKFGHVHPKLRHNRALSTWVYSQIHGGRHMGDPYRLDKLAAIGLLTQETADKLKHLPRELVFNGGGPEAILEKLRRDPSLALTSTTVTAKKRNGTTSAPSSPSTSD